MKREMFVAAVGYALLGSIGFACAQTAYPTRTVTIVSPTAPGGSYSIYAQMLANSLEKRLGKAVIVENKPGAGTVIGTHQVAKSEPDGHTLLMGATPGLAINVSLRKSIPYDVEKDFTPIALFATAPQVLVVNADLPIHSVADIARIAKEKPGSLNFASNGPGTVLHLAGEMMKSMLDVDIVHVPYKGAAPAMNDVAAGHVSMMFISVASAGSLLESGKVRIIGVTSQQPLASLPNVRPLAKNGLPGFDAAIWYLIAAPAGTPQTVVDRLHRELKEAVREPEVSKRIVDLGAVVIDSPTPVELRTFVRSEAARWGKVVNAAGLAGSM